MIAYFDTSALIKLVLVEEGSQIALQLWNGADVVLTSLLSYPEARAALARGRRSHRLTQAEHVAAKNALTKYINQTRIIDLTEELAQRAGDLAELFHLRGYDAVHLACAVAPDDPGIVMTSWDLDLREAAEEAGLVVASA